MDLSVIEISPDEARARLSEYTEAIRHERTAQDEAIAMGYRAAARGMPVIKLSETIRAGGFFGNGLPKIAIIRATERECSVRWSGEDLIYSDVPRGDNRGALVGQFTVRVPVAEPPGYRSRWGEGTTIVPLIPPRFRPKPRRLRRCHILWEVEEWKRVPPRDPALLHHIRGDLWAVLAVWDLSELERAVLAM